VCVPLFFLPSRTDDDGDDEEFDENDLKRALELYEENKDLDREGGNEAQD
jgi:hypothetical protein